MARGDEPDTADRGAGAPAGRWRGVRPDRRYPALPPELDEQLRRVAPSVDGAMVYRPCQVLLRDGRSLPRVYVVAAGPYLRHRGVWPEDDRGKRAVSIRDVARIAESPLRLPAALAEKLYRAGESGMGYCLFTLVLADGRRVPAVTGNAVDFPPLLPGVGPETIVAVLPHVERAAMHQAGWPHVSWRAPGLMLGLWHGVDERAGSGRGRLSIPRAPR